MFAGSSLGAFEAYAAAARDLGRTLVSRGCTLVYGGADIGLMGVLADTVLALPGGTAAEPCWKTISDRGRSARASRRDLTGQASGRIFSATCR